MENIHDDQRPDDDAIDAVTCPDCGGRGEVEEGDGFFYDCLTCESRGFVVNAEQETR